MTSKTRVVKASVASLLKGLESPVARVKFGSSKALRLLSAEEPESLYPHFDFFVRQLDCENSFLRWDAARILANLAPADRDNKLEGVLEKILSPIPGPQMIGAANVIVAASDIARAKPHLADRIAREILRVQDACYQTEECRNVAIGHAIRSLEQFFELIGNREEVLEFVRAQLGNSRNATRKKAESFLKRRPALRRTAVGR